MESLIVSVFPDKGRYNPITGLKHHVNFYVKPYFHDPNDIHSVNPEFPKNYIDMVRSCLGKFPYIIVSSKPAVRKALSKEEDIRKNLVVIYPTCDKETRDELFSNIKAFNAEGDYCFAKALYENWEYWHKEARIHCKENSIPYYEVSNPAEFIDLVERLGKELNDKVSGNAVQE